MLYQRVSHREEMQAMANSTILKINLTPLNSSEHATITKCSFSLTKVELSEASPETSGVLVLFGSL